MKQQNFSREVDVKITSDQYFSPQKKNMVLLLKSPELLIYKHTDKMPAHLQVVLKSTTEKMFSFLT